MKVFSVCVRKRKWIQLKLRVNSERVGGGRMSFINLRAIRGPPR